jgi:divalent metal cation (Fe/Co/Zn/Cd) transporter
LSALLLYQILDLPVFDALGALSAALFMLLGSLFLMAQARALITGRAVPEVDLQHVRRAILADPKVEAVNHLAAIYAGATEVLIDADLDLAESLSTTEIETLLDAFEQRVRQVMPNTERVRVLLNSPTKSPYDRDSGKQR